RWRPSTRPSPRATKSLKTMSGVSFARRDSIDSPAAMSMGAPESTSLVPFFRETCGINERQAAALAKPDKIGGSAELVDHDVEIGQIGVDREVPHLRRCRTPIRDENALQ